MRLPLEREFAALEGRSPPFFRFFHRDMRPEDVELLGAELGRCLSHIEWDGKFNCLKVHENPLYARKAIIRCLAEWYQEQGAVRQMLQD